MAFLNKAKSEVLKSFDAILTEYGHFKICI